MHSSPSSQPIPRRRPTPAPAQRHALPEHFRFPTQRRCTPAGCAMHSPPKAFARPPTATRPSRTLPLLHAAPMHARRLRDAFPAEGLPRPRTATRPSEHFRSPTLRRCTPAGCAMHSSPTSQHLPRRRPSPALAQRHALPELFRSPTQRRCTPADCAMHSSPPSQPIPRRRPAPAPHSDTLSPSTSAPPRSPDARPPTARCIPRRPHSPFPAAPPCLPLPFRFGHKKNGTAQRVCDAECLGRPSLRSVIGVGEPRAVRRRCGALAWRVGLRPQPWALRSRRCGRVLRA